MSAQIMDSIVIENNTYSIAEVSTPSMMFKLSEYGLHPSMTCTACFRGHWCDYEIKDSHFFLKDFYMYNGEQHYPLLNGVNVLGEKMGHKKYEGVNIFIPYTGKMLVGKGLIYDFYKNGGRQNCWAYKEMIECTFVGGKLILLIDYSCLVENLREYIKNEGLSKIYTRYEEIPELYWGQLEWMLK